MANGGIRELRTRSSARAAALRIPLRATLEPLLLAKYFLSRLNPADRTTSQHGRRPRQPRVTCRAKPRITSSSLADREPTVRPRVKKNVYVPRTRSIHVCQPRVSPCHV